MTGRILIVEDEPKIASLLEDYLAAHGFTCRQVHRGDQALDEYHAHSPDLVLLDLMLPGIDGIEVCKQIRLSSTVPIIIRITSYNVCYTKLLRLRWGWRCVAQRAAPSGVRHESDQFPAGSI